MRARWFALCALLSVCLSLVVLARGSHDKAKKKPAVSAEEARKQLIAADKFARTIAGKDEYQYHRLLAAAFQRIRAARAARAAIHDGHTDQQKEGIVSPFATARAKALAKAARLASIFNDPSWQKNAKKLFDLQMKPEGKIKVRIIGGVHTTEDEFPDCVAVGASGSFCCTGTLIGPNVVLTAGHCGDGGCASRVYVGIDANHPDPKKIYKVKKAIIHEQFNAMTLANDLTLLILDRNVEGVTPRKIADTKDVEAAFFIRLVGFGLTEMGIFGEQNKVDVPIGSASCDGQDGLDKYGCHKGKEMVAGGQGKDSCNGDSGGPAYIMKDNEWYLAGATSRATRNSVQSCGDGGIYVRVDQYLDWIKDTAKKNGGKLP
jgi:hypothetical protein